MMVPLQNGIAYLQGIIINIKRRCFQSSFYSSVIIQNINSSSLLIVLIAKNEERALQTRICCVTSSLFAIF